ncbi:unnamed protein product [Oncorhynchus mykiss]|uniref:Uncharacterized protein n=1 Tax=Oncorhynchus mykiss TaxID=8022 RepID=A0A060W294_ONCMY|nr:unnamed protein product [Oncorhynchus mykiss]
MATATRNQVLSLYIRVFWIAWGAVHTPTRHCEYIVQEAQTLFRQNQQSKRQTLYQESIKKCLAECETRMEIGLYYRNPYPRLIYLLIMGLATQKGRKLKAQQRMRKQASQFTYSHMRTADTTADTR